jgi:hypothetical protein
MRKIIAAGLTALTLVGSLSAGAASAQDWRRDGYGYRYHHDNDAGAAIGAGIAGLALGAALADSGRGRYVDGYYYGPPAYAYDYYYGSDYYGPRHCSTRRMWDPYLGRYVDQTRCWR